MKCNEKIISSLKKIIKAGILITPFTIIDVKNNPQILIDFIEELNANHGGTIGLRGIWKDELWKKKLKRSWLNWDDQVPTQLKGTSVTIIECDWDYCIESDLIDAIKKAIKHQGYLYGDTPYIALVTGHLEIDEIFNDPGEGVLSNAIVLAYIPKR